VGLKSETLYWWRSCCQRPAAAVLFLILWGMFCWLICNDYSCSTSTVSEHSCNQTPSSSTSTSSPDYDATPPLSNARTTVWYWSLGGVSTTLMYSRHSREVWCNGTVIDTEVRPSDSLRAFRGASLQISPRMWKVYLKEIVLRHLSVDDFYSTSSWIIVAHDHVMTDRPDRGMQSYHGRRRHFESGSTSEQKTLSLMKLWRYSSK